jgi:hypothetical protein
VVLLGEEIFLILNQEMVVQQHDLRLVLADYLLD